MNYFDFHTHVLLKQLFEDSPNIDLEIYPSDVKLLPELCSDLPTIIESQIAPAQLLSLKSQLLIGVALYGLESYLAAAVDPLRSNLKASAQYKLSHQVLMDIAGTTY